MLPTNYLGWLKGWQIRGNQVELGLLRAHAMGQIEKVVLDISPKMESVGESYVRDADIVSVEFENSQRYMAHFFKARNKLFKILAGNVIENQRSFDAVSLGQYSFRISARWNIWGYDRTVTWTKNVEDWKVGHPVFPDYKFKESEQPAGRIVVVDLKSNPFSK